MNANIDHTHKSKSIIDNKDYHIRTDTFQSAQLQKNKSPNKILAQVDEYICPMKCEGDKTYQVPRRCPKCRKQLVLAHGGYLYY